MVPPCLPVSLSLRSTEHLVTWFNTSLLQTLCWTRIYSSKSEVLMVIHSGNSPPPQPIRLLPLPVPFLLRLYLPLLSSHCSAHWAESWPNCCFSVIPGKAPNLSLLCWSSTLQNPFLPSGSKPSPSPASVFTQMLSPLLSSWLPHRQLQRPSPHDNCPHQFLPLSTPLPCLISPLINLRNQVFSSLTVSLSQQSVDFMRTEIIVSLVSSSVRSLDVC